MVVNYMINHHQLIYQNKFTTLMSLYGMEEDTPDPHRGWVAPISFKQYLHLLLHHDFWGDEIVLYTIFCMWSMKITVVNMKTLQEYRIRHDQVAKSMQWWPTMQIIISMQQVCGQPGGHFVLFASKNQLTWWSPGDSKWSHSWLHCRFSLVHSVDLPVAFHFSGH